MERPEGGRRRIVRHRRNRGRSDGPSPREGIGASQLAAVRKALSLARNAPTLARNGPGLARKSRSIAAGPPGHRRRCFLPRPRSSRAPTPGLSAPTVRLPGTDVGAFCPDDEASGHRHRSFLPRPRRSRASTPELFAPRSELPSPAIDAFRSDSAPAAPNDRIQLPKQRLHPTRRRPGTPRPSLALPHPRTIPTRRSGNSYPTPSHPLMAPFARPRQRVPAGHFRPAH